MKLRNYFSCKKCQNCFKHEENVALFKQHQYHFHCFLCINCQKQVTHESFYLDEKFQFDVNLMKKTITFRLKRKFPFVFLLRYQIHKFIVKHVI